MPKKSTSLLLCFPTSSSTPSLAAAAGVTSQSVRPLRSRSSSLSASVMSALYFFFLLFANVALLCTGSIFLSWLEMPREDELRRLMALKRSAFIERFLHNSSSSAKVLDQLLGLVQESAQKGIVTNFPDGNLHHNSVWSFGSAFLFLTTIATTVGYGHAAPQTGIGKAFSMIYGTIAIPLLLAFFGELIRKLVALLNWLFMHTIGRRFRAGKQQSIDDNGNADNNNNAASTDVRVKIAFVLFVSVVLIFSTVFIPAFTFATLEPRWSFLDALYYCFISMTTVGLGDVIPGEGPEWNLNPDGKEFYHISVALYLLIALPLFFLAIKLISSLVTTAEMSFRGGTSAVDDYDDDEEEDDDRKMRCKPRIKVDEAVTSEDDSDDDDYDASSGLISSKRPVVRNDSDTQVTSDGDDDNNTIISVSDDNIANKNNDLVTTTTTTGGGGSFALLYPQPGQQSNINNGGDLNNNKNKSKHSVRK